MKKALLLIALCLASTPGAAQVVPSAFVPHGATCVLFADGVSPDRTTYFQARSLCNIPPEANALAVHVLVESRADGRLRLFDSGLAPETVKPLLAFRRGSSSTFAIVRLCYPAEECSAVDFGLSVTAAARVTIVVAGYTAPMQ